MAFLLAIFLCGLLAATAGRARVYDTVEVRGAKTIPEADIKATCGELTGIDLDTVQMQSVEDCLMYTGVFESVSLREEGDLLVIDVVEIEDHPGRVDVGIAWVNDRGLTGTLGYHQFNLIPDTFTSAQIDYSSHIRSYDLSLYRPDAFSPHLGFGLALSGYRSDFDELAFSKRNTQIEAYIAWTGIEGLRLDAGIGYRSHRMFDLDTDASALLQLEKGEVEAPFLHFVLRYEAGKAEDARDYRLRFDQYFWNLKSGRAISESRLDAGLRQRLAAGTDLHLDLRGGIVSSLSDSDTTALDRMFIGGEGFRGFAPRGVGPADGDDLLGADRFITASVEVQHELGTAFDRTFRGGVFVDFGSAWSLENTLGGAIDDDAHFRSTIGVSLVFDLGGVPVSIYAATPLKHQPQDDRQVLGLSVAATF